MNDSLDNTEFQRDDDAEISDDAIEISDSDLDLSHCFLGEMSLHWGLILCSEQDHDRDCDLTNCSFGEVSLCL